MDNRADGRPCRLYGGARHFDRQCRTAAHRGQPLGQPGGIDLGADLLPGHQCHRPAGQRVAGIEDRAQTLFHGMHHRLQRDLAAVRRRAEPHDADHCPRLARHYRRRASAERPGDPRRQLSAGKARPGVCRLWPRGGVRAGDRTDARGLDHRQFHLALGVLAQCAGWVDAVAPGGARAGRPARAGGAAPRPAALGLYRFCSARRRHGRAADRARQGSGGRLVRQRLHHRFGRDQRGVARRFCRVGAAPRGPDRRSAAARRAQLRPRQSADVYAGPYSIGQHNLAAAICAIHAGLHRHRCGAGDLARAALPCC